MRERKAHRLAVAMSVATMVALVSPTLPANAGPVPTRLTVTANATAVVHSVVPVRGAARPAQAGATLDLQVASGTTWTTVSTVHEAAGGVFTFRFRGPGVVSTSVLRVSRHATSRYGAGVSRSFSVRFDKHAFVVTAKPSSSQPPVGSPLTITGKVTPAAAGKVYLERQAGVGVWTTVTSTTLKGSAYSFTTPTIANGSIYRVVKPGDLVHALGASPPFRVEGSVPGTTTIRLPHGYVGLRYTTALHGGGGTAPYTWTGVALPAGLTLAPGGVISGIPAAPGTTTVTVTVKDAKGFSSSRTLSLVVQNVAVKSWGYNSDGYGSGYLGNGTSVDSLAPAATLLPARVQDVSFTNLVTVALTTDGNVWTSGVNFNGDLGLGLVGRVSVLTPTQVTSLHNVVAVATGVANGYALEADGSVWAWGDGESGQLGNGANIDSNVPLKVPGLTGVVAITAGADFAMAQLANGTVMSWGSNNEGELGRHNKLTIPGANPGNVPAPVLGLGTSPATTPVSIQAGWYNGYAMMPDGTVQSWGEAQARGWDPGPSPTEGDISLGQVTGLAHVLQLSCDGEDLCYALNADGTVSAWGQGTEGQLGDGAKHGSLLPKTIAGLTNVVQIANQDFGGLAITGTGPVLAWGTGYLGNGTAPVTQPIIPTVVPQLQGALKITAGPGHGFVWMAS